MQSKVAHSSSRVISFFRKSVRDFSEQKDFYGFLMNFSVNKKPFSKGIQDFLGM